MTGHSFYAVLLICLSFAALHSFMVSAPGKEFFGRLLGRAFMQSYYRLLFVGVSSVTMFGTFFLIMSLPDAELFRAPVRLQYLLYACQIAGMLFGMMSLAVLDAPEFFGIRQLKRRRSLSGSESAPLTIDGLLPVSVRKTGVYSIIRHPIYFAGIIMISLQPVITVNRLTVTILADCYFIYAALKEERIFMRNPSACYDLYRQQVPMFNILKGLYGRFVRQLA